MIWSWSIKIGWSFQTDHLLIIFDHDHLWSLFFMVFFHILFFSVQKEKFFLSIKSGVLGIDRGCVWHGPKLWLITYESSRKIDLVLKENVHLVTFRLGPNVDFQFGPIRKTDHIYKNETTIMIIQRVGKNRTPQVPVFFRKVEHGYRVLGHRAYIFGLYLESLSRLKQNFRIMSKGTDVHFWTFSQMFVLADKKMLETCLRAHGERAQWRKFGLYWRN